ncbi:MAG: hypothetical protein JO247_07965 [Chloroflexi bacterium]|nr:hypothetical protein [Chloroflexota bacterium]
MASPQEPVRAAEKTVDAIVRQAMDDHMRSLIDGKPERVRSDFAESVQDRVADFERLIPSGLKAYQLLHDRVDGDTSYMIVRVEGAETHDLEWVWSNEKGRFRIVQVRRTGA